MFHAAKMCSVHKYWEKSFLVAILDSFNVSVDILHFFDKLSSYICTSNSGGSSYVNYEQRRCLTKENQINL